MLLHNGLLKKVLRKNVFRTGLLRNCVIVFCLSSVSGLALADESFPQCVQRLQDLARQKGIPDYLITELASVKHLKRTIKYDRNQPEFVQTFAGYYERRVNDYRILGGRAMLAAHREFLTELTRRYGVPAQYLIAFWAMESNFGRNIGKMPILDTLATLACDDRRSEFFTGELFSALELMDRYQFGADEMAGSWAGAIGQTQFLPSAYVRFGVDGDGDQRVDLWRSQADALTSAANYLQQLGWKPELRWGREVQLPPDFPYHLAGIASFRPIREWRQHGVVKVDGTALPDVELEAALLIPAGAEGPKFLVYENFKVIMKWNRSQFYALSVGILSDRINGAGRLRHPPPDIEPLTRQQIQQLQQALQERGFDPGSVDGQLGPQTSSAIRGFQKSQNLLADGFADKALLKLLVE